MREWNAQEMRELFQKKAQENGMSITSFLEQFVREMDANHIIHATTLARYLKEGSKGPTKGPEKQALYEKMEADFGYDMHGDVPVVQEDAVFSMEDKKEKIPGFCQTHLDVIFVKIYDYIENAYQGNHPFMFETDFNYLWYNYMLCKPLLPNYVCMKLKELLERTITFVKEDLEREGLVLFEGIGVMYKDELKEGEEPNLDFCEETEDYIKLNLKAHRKRVCTFFEAITTFWETSVETLYQEESDTVKKVRERFKKLQIQEENE